MKTKKLVFVLSGLLALAACSDDDDNVAVNVPVDPAPADPAPADPEPDPEPAEPVEVAFEISVTNLTAGQPFSPVAVIAAGADYRAFELGQAASVDLEYLAEGGDNSFLIDGVSDAVATASGEAPVGPGATDTITLRFDEAELAEAYVNVVTMLVNTNDAITAVQGIALAEMAVGDSVAMTSASYDSGTEANTESSGTIPGPADGGEGFNTERDDSNIVLAHAGVVTADDGLATSRLTAIHRWDNPVARIAISRVE